MTNRVLDRIDTELSRFSLSDNGNYMDGMRDGMSYSSTIVQNEMDRILNELEKEIERQENPAMQTGLRNALYILNGQPLDSTETI